MAKRIKFPTSVVILGRRVKIKQRKGLFYEGRQCLGLCDYTNKTIYLEKDQTQEEKVDTLHHELAHFFMILLGMDQTKSVAEIEIYAQSFAALIKDIGRIPNWPSWP